jgi:hypothetical protein
MSFPGYSALVGPETLNVAGRFVNSPRAYELWHKVLVALGKAQTWESLVPIVAYVNHGRWVALCHWCKKGILTRPDWGVAYCAQCGAKYGKGWVKFPENHEEITKALVVRPDPETQNWDNKQTVDDLIRENREELHLG